MFPRKLKTARHRCRRSFTLTELLVVVMIISLLASTVMFAMYGAVEEARAARTRAQIVRLNELLMTRWESYRTRAIRLRDTPPSPRAAAHARLHALRDLMRMEMPDRASDISDLPILIPETSNRLPPPSLWREYRRRVQQATGSPSNNPTQNWDDLDYEDAECLYMIIASIRGPEGNGLDYFKESEIGDVNENGLPEILDAWGNPIIFIRWPAGFVEHSGFREDTGVSFQIPSYSSLQQVIPDDEDEFVTPEARDAFDPLRVDNQAKQTIDAALGSSHNMQVDYYFNFNLYPLVMSAGPDGRYDIHRRDYTAQLDPDDPNYAIRLPFDYYRVPPGEPHAYRGVPNDPYSILPVSKRRLGMPYLDSQGYVDNIHNHALGDR